MSKDPFQILADELTLIRKDMDQLQRTSVGHAAGDQRNPAGPPERVESRQGADGPRSLRSGHQSRAGGR